jgi:YbgC/YbaW family acyl-CoA thioester hydrolase
MTAPFRTTRRVEFGDTDMAGIVHFANFFRYMEAAEQEFLRARGLSVKMEWEGQALGFPRVSASCDFVQPARFEDVLTVTVGVSNVGRKSVTYSFEFTRGDEVIARGQVSTVCCRVSAGSPLESVEIPAAVREKLEQGKAD